MATIPEQALAPHGSGPMATVHTITSTDGRTYAVKVFGAPFDSRLLDVLEAERDLLAGLRSVSSILLVDSVDELSDGRGVLRMEFCPHSLADAGALPLGAVINVGTTVATVLADAHAVGIVHGGVTPGNVLLRSRGQPVLADFGLSLRQRFPADPAGQAAFIAPEVLRDGEPTTASDMYGLGAVLYLALTGRPPFGSKPGEPPDELVLRVLRDPAPAVADESIAGLIAAMLAKNPADRPTARAVAEELHNLAHPDAASGIDLDDFDDFRDAQTTTAAPVPDPTPVQPKPRVVIAKAESRRRRVTPRMVVGVLAAASIAAVIPVFLRPGNQPQSAPSTPPSATPSATPSSTPPAVKLELSAPLVTGDKATLNWRSTKPLTYVLVIAEQGSPTDSVPMGSRTTWTMDLRPGLKYCFLVQGTDGRSVYSTPPKPIRGATCKN